MVLLFHILLLILTIIGTDYILRVVFNRWNSQESFQHRFLYFLLVSFYFIVLLDYEHKNGFSIQIPTEWHLGDLLLAGFLSLSGMFILLLILWFDFSSYNQDKEVGMYGPTEEKVSSYAWFPGWLAIFVLAFISGITEELIFRYYIIDRLSILTPHLDWSVGLASVLYGLTYYSKSGWMSVCFRGIVGFLLSVLYILTENLLFVIFIHIVWNVIMLSITSNQLDQLFKKLRKASDYALPKK